MDRLARPDAVPKLARAIRSSGCDVVHAHLEDSSPLAPIAARLARRPALCTLHHVPVPLRGREALRERLAVMAGSRSSGLVMVSQASYDGFARRYPRSHDPARWSVVHNGVDLERFRPLGPADAAALPADLGIPSGVPVVALVGHMRIGKGQDVAVRAWPEVLATQPDARLLLVGNGPLEAELRQSARDLGVESRVVFAGARDDVQEILPRATLVVLPTRMEALPTALMEAAAAGIPSVATDVGGVPEVVVDGETGWLVPIEQVDDGTGTPVDPDAFVADLAGRLTEAVSDVHRAKHFGLAGRTRAVEHFSWASIGDRTMEVYGQVLGG